MTSTRIGWSGMALAMLLTALFTGCYPIIDEKTPAEETVKGAPDVVKLNDPEEIATIAAVEQSRAEYLSSLQLLQAYYYKIGNLDKQRWAREEYQNVNTTRTWKWDGVETPTVAGGADLANETEHSLVEPLMVARAQYKKSVNNAIAMYQARGAEQQYKTRLMQSMKARLDPVRVYPYFPEVQLPPLTLRGTEMVPEAEQLYDQAYKLWRSGKYFPGVSNYEKERQALAKFLTLVEEYPNSRRIARSAYYIAEIYKEYFTENALCVHWYERAWTWDPHIEEPACFQAATVYDVHLHNYVKAVECYKKSLSRPDPERLGNATWSRDRIAELTGQK